MPDKIPESDTLSDVINEKPSFAVRMVTKHGGCLIALGFICVVAIILIMVWQQYNLIEREQAVAVATAKLEEDLKTHEKIIKELPDLQRNYIELKDNYNKTQTEYVEIKKRYDSQKKIYDEAHVAIEEYKKISKDYDEKIVAKQKIDEQLKTGAKDLDSLTKNIKLMTEKSDAIGKELDNAQKNRDELNAELAALDMRPVFST